MFHASTQGVEVSVMPVFLEEQSDPGQDVFVWAYRVVIVNGGNEPLQLLSRYWHITDGLGRVEEISGDGVTGEQPTLDCGDSYEYTSGCPLKTPSGIMRGHYQVKTRSGKSLEIEIPAFSLDIPDNDPVMN